MRKFNINFNGFLVIEEDIKMWAKKNNIILLNFNKENTKKIISLINYHDFSKKHINYNINRKRYFEDCMRNINTIGKPDYFAYTKKGNKTIEFCFIEYKSRFDYLRKEQIFWFKKNHRLPLALIYSLKRGNNYKKNAKVK